MNNDIIQDLWSQFIDTEGLTLRDAVKAIYKLEISSNYTLLFTYDKKDWTGRMSLIRKDTYAQLLAAGGGKTMLDIDIHAADLITIGRFWADLSEPCIKYVLDEFDNSML